MKKINKIFFEYAYKSLIASFLSIIVFSFLYWYMMHNELFPFGEQIGGIFRLSIVFWALLLFGYYINEVSTK